MCSVVLSLRTKPWLSPWEETHNESIQQTPHNNHPSCVCLTLPVWINPLGDHGLGVIFQQVPYVEVGGCVEHTEDCWSGLSPLQSDHRFTCCTVLPLCHRLLMADCMQPDGAIPTTHLEEYMVSYIIVISQSLEITLKLTVLTTAPPCCPATKILFSNMAKCQKSALSPRTSVARRGKSGLSWRQQVELQPPETCKTLVEPSNRDLFHDWRCPRQKWY